MTVEEKLTAAYARLASLALHCSVLEKDVRDAPDADVAGKTPRSAVLVDFLRRKEAIENHIRALKTL